MKKRILSLLPLALLLAAILCAPALALTEAEVEAQVAASSKEAVTGNVLIWFLCAVAFLKVSQKIDSFMASMGVNVGRTGGSLMAEAMIAVRGASMIAKAGGSVLGGFGRSGGGSSSGQASSGSAGSTGGFFKGGLIGMAGRHITNSAVKTATTQTSAVHTAQKQSATAATHSASTIRSNGNSSSASHTASSAHTVGGENTIHSAEHTGSDIRGDSVAFSETMSQQEGVIITGQESQSAVHTDSSVQASRTDSSAQHTHTQGGGGESISGRGSSSQPTYASSHVAHQTSIGGAVFARSLASGGRFANDVIGSVARGEAAGSITGAMAAQSLHSYLGYTGSGKQAPTFSGAEIGGGRITGYLSTPERPQSIAFGMYHAGQYTEPTGAFSKVRSADGALWYTQLAQDTVERKPYKAPDGSVTYEERIVKKLPTPPKRKDRI